MAATGHASESVLAMRASFGPWCPGDTSHLIVGLPIAYTIGQSFFSKDVGNKLTINHVMESRGVAPNMTQQSSSFALTNVSKCYAEQHLLPSFKL